MTSPLHAGAWWCVVSCDCVWLCMLVCVCVLGGCVCLLSKPWEQGALRGCEAGSQGLQQYICCCFSPKHPPFPGESFLSPPSVSPSFPPYFAITPPIPSSVLVETWCVRLLPPLCRVSHQRCTSLVVMEFGEDKKAERYSRSIGQDLWTQYENNIRENRFNYKLKTIKNYKKKKIIFIGSETLFLSIHPSLLCRRWGPSIHSS